MARLGGGMPRVLKRAAAIAAGVLLGMAVTAGASAWQAWTARSSRVDVGPDTPASAPVRRERAPDPRA